LVTFLPFGHSGADIRSGLLGLDGGGPKWINGMSQIDEVVRAVGKKRIGALLIQIGVNDVGVSGVLEHLLTMDSAKLDRDRVGTKEQLQAKIKAGALAEIAALPAKFDLLKQEIKRLNVRHVYLTEYPTALFDGGDGFAKAGCGIFESATDLLNLDKSDATMVKVLARDLNRKLKAEAARLGWFYIDGIADGFTTHAPNGGAQGHGYCTDDHYFRQAEESMAIQGDTEGTIHPNDKGTKVIGKRVAAIVKRRTINVPDGPPVVVGPARQRVRRDNRRPGGVPVAR
jgi:hypothetical protein